MKMVLKQFLGVSENMATTFCSYRRKSSFVICFVILILAFLQLMQKSFIQSPSFSECLEQRTQMAQPSTPPEVDTSIIILSSLIPTHPSIQIVNETFNSLALMLDGLPNNTLKFLSVDGLPPKHNTPENIHRLHGYVKQLRLRFREDPYVTIVNNYEHGHISNSIRVTLELVKTEFIYVVQHDFSFAKHVNHTALVAAMRERPDELQIVRFWRKHYKPDHTANKGCYPTSIQTHGIHFVRGKWSDNNHLTTKSYYEKLLAKIGETPRPPEAPMMHASGSSTNSSEDCNFLNQWVYNWHDGPIIKHLDGRHTQTDV